jgi:hypothetical protein
MLVSIAAVIRRSHSFMLAPTSCLICGSGRCPRVNSAMLSGNYHDFLPWPNICAVDGWDPLNLDLHDALTTCRKGISGFACPLPGLLRNESYILAMMLSRRARSGFLVSEAKCTGREIVDFVAGDTPNAFGNPSSLCEGSRLCQAKVGGGGGVRERCFFSIFSSCGGALVLDRDPDVDEVERIDHVK